MEKINKRKKITTISIFSDADYFIEKTDDEFFIFRRRKANLN